MLSENKGVPAGEVIGALGLKQAGFVMAGVVDRGHTHSFYYLVVLAALQSTYQN